MDNYARDKESTRTHTHTHTHTERQKVARKTVKCNLQVQQFIHAASWRPSVYPQQITCIYLLCFNNVLVSSYKMVTKADKNLNII